MRNILTAICIGALLFFLTPGQVLAEAIERFTVEAAIRKDGYVDIRETIRYDFGPEERHGIYRTIPLIKTNQEGKKFRMDAQGITVGDETGAKLPFTEGTEDGNLKLKIGSADITVSGVKTYVISYTLGGAVTYFADHDELNWNAVGADWDVPVAQALFRIRLPESFPDAEVKARCFTGAYGSTESSCRTGYADGAVTVETTRNLDAGEGLTGIAWFPRNVVAVREPEAVVNFFDTPLGRIVGIVLLIGTVIGGIVWYLLLPLIIVYRWWRTGRDPKPPMGVASAWFSPPQTDRGRDLTPGETGTLVDEQADLRDISATLVDLARRGYLTIVEKAKNDFILEKRSGVSRGDTLQPFEQELYDGLFAGRDTVKIKGTDLVTTVTNVKKKLYEQVVADGFFVTNPETQRTKYSVMGVLALVTGNLLLAIIAFVFGRAMPRKTLSGAQQAAVGLSLKNFLRSQDSFLAFQAKNQLYFEKLLPYAVAFGVEKIWAQRFRDVEMKQPDWYRSYHHGFALNTFVGSLDNSFSSFYRSATPTSSSSGFSSGFSGGGFSGGGGGGGGGGSW